MVVFSIGFLYNLCIESKYKENFIMNIFKQVKEFYKQESKATLTIYLILRTLVIVCLIFEIIRGNWNNAFLCILTLFLYLIPFLVDKKLNIDLPNTMDILIFLFIFSAEILGEIQNFYGIIKHWDTILHTINGFLCAAIGFSLIDILNRNTKININLSPIFVAIVAFCFSMTIGVLWEFFEYGCDKFLNVDMQKDTVIQKISSVALNPDGENKAVVVDDIGKTIIYDTNGDVLQVIDNGYLDIGLNDTIEDLFVNFIGAIVFSCFAFFDLKHNRSNSFINRFVPTKGNNKLIKSI